MRTMSYSQSRAHYAEVLDSVVDDREEIVITRAGKEPVIVSLDDYESMKETAYLMRSPENARTVREAVDRLERGEGVEHAHDRGVKLSGTRKPGRPTLVADATRKILRRIDLLCRTSSATATGGSANLSHYVTSFRGIGHSDHG